MLSLKNIDKYYNIGSVNETCVFNDFNLEIEDSQFVSVIGSNGSGKTTLLNVICGSLSIEGGSIIFDGKDISKEKEHKRYQYIGRVFQSPSMGVSPSMTILENLSIAANKGNRWNLSKGVNKVNIEKYMDLVRGLDLGLEDKLDVKVGDLSGGQRQAISLIMASMTDIKILILDEHTAALDPKTADKIMELTDKIVREKKLTALMVTHNLNYALNYGNRILMMHQGQVILDNSGKDKEDLVLDQVLDKFNQISIEFGN